MSDDDTDTTGAPTRRDYVKYGGAVVGGALVAGCTGDQSDQGTSTETTTTDTETATEAATETTTDSG